MWPVIFSAFRAVAAALCSGIAVKVMDDCIDAEYDAALDLPNLANRYGSGVVAYGMLALLVAAVSHLPLTVALFAAAYAVGMGPTDNTVYPSSLSGKAELILVVLASAAFGGVRLTLVALSVMAGAQLVDNWLDEKKGLLYPVSAVGLFACAMLLSRDYALWVLIAYALFFALERWCRCSLQ